MTSPRVRWSFRIFAPLLPTALAVALVLAGFMIDRTGALAAAETAKSEPGASATPETAPPVAPVAPATPQVAPPAPGTPPLAAPTAPEAPATRAGGSCQRQKSGEGQEGCQDTQMATGRPPRKNRPPGQVQRRRGPRVCPTARLAGKNPAGAAGFDPAGEAHRRLLRQPALHKDGGAGRVPQGRDAAAPER